MLDTTWGVVVLLVFLQLTHSLAQRMDWQDVVESGFYGEPPQLRIWFKQLAAYAFAVLLMKLLDSLIILWYYEPMAAFATALFSSFTQHRHLELLLVMIIIPGCCNSFQFWVRTHDCNPISLDRNPSNRCWLLVDVDRRLVSQV